MTLKDINNKFLYTPDKNLDSWTGLQWDGEHLLGDCEDYCIDLKRYVDDFKDWNYYYCKLNGVGHCILSDGKSMIDCNLKAICSLQWYKDKQEVTDLKKYNWFVVFSKLLVGKLKLLLKD